MASRNEKVCFEPFDRVPDGRGTLEVKWNSPLDNDGPKTDPGWRGYGRPAPFSLGHGEAFASAVIKYHLDRSTI